MGLTIKYILSADVSESEARKLIHLLHQAARDLPFTAIGEVVELKGVLAEQRHYPEDHQHFNLLGSGWEPLTYDWRVTGPTSSISRSADVYPSHLIAFEAMPGEGCDPAGFGLCRYPEFVEVGPRRIRTGLVGWRWSTFCKTQFASNPKCGGVENFLRCHLSVVALLDKAKALGFKVEVDDEGGFESRRSVPELLREVGICNENIAAFFSILQSVGGPGVRGEIQRFPNFEHHEVVGLNKPKMTMLRQLFAAVGAKFDDPPA